MKPLKVLLMIVILLTSLTSVTFAANTDWQYVLTRNDIAYSVDMNSVEPVTIGINFWLIMDNHDTNKLLMANTTVNVKTRQFRFEKAYIFNSKTKKIISTEKRPTDWTKIRANSPMEITVDYIFDHKLKNQE